MRRIFRHKLALGGIVIGLGLTALLWPTSQGAILRLDAEQAVFAPAGHQAALITTQGVQIWDETTGMQPPLTSNTKASIIPGDTRQPLAWHPSGTYLAFPGDQLEIDIWDVEQRNYELSLTGATSPAELLAFSPDSTLLSAIDREGNLYLWRWRSQTLLWQSRNVPPAFLVFNATGTRLITSEKVYNSQDGAEVFSYKDLRDSFFRCTAAEPKQELVASCLGSGTVSIIDLKQRKVQQIFQALDGPGSTLAFSPDSRFLAVGSGIYEMKPVASSAIKVFDLQTKQEVWSVPLQLIVHVRQIHFSADGQQLVAVVKDAPFLFLNRRSVYIWNLPTP